MAATENADEHKAIVERIVDDIMGPEYKREKPAAPPKEKTEEEKIIEDIVNRII
jgi:hypothetical protein